MAENGQKGFIMIVTCASCLTKFRLDDSKISEKGAKVRCSKCYHVFYVTLPPESKEAVTESFESFAKYHTELIEPDQKGVKIPSQPKGEKNERMSEEEQKSLFSEMGSIEKGKREISKETPGEERGEATLSRPKRMVGKERRGPSLVFVILVILVLFLFGFFYLWTESGTSGSTSSLLEYPLQKVTSLWQKIVGSEKEGLIFRDLSGYEEKIEEVPLFVIEGKVNNQSKVAKKHIKVRVAIFDEKKVKMGEKETVCGRMVSREELSKLPVTFFKGEMTIRPKTDKEMITPPGKTSPFMVVFKNLSTPPKEFQVEILEAPSL